MTPQYARLFSNFERFGLGHHRDFDDMAFCLLRSWHHTEWVASSRGGRRSTITTLDAGLRSSDWRAGFKLNYHSLGE